MLGLEPILADYKAAGEVDSYLISAPGFGGSGFNSGNAVNDSQGLVFAHAVGR